MSRYRSHGWGHCLICTAPSLRQNLLPEPCQEIRMVGLVMNNRLLVIATIGEVGEGAGYSIRRWRAMNAEPHGRLRSSPYLSCANDWDVEL